MLVLIGSGILVLLAGLFLIARIKRQQKQSANQKNHTKVYGQFVKSNRFIRQAGELSSNAVSEQSESLNVAQHPAAAASANKSNHDSQRNREVGLMDEESRKLEDDFLEPENELAAFKKSTKSRDDLFEMDETTDIKQQFEANLSSTTPAKEPKSLKVEKAGFWARLFGSKKTTQAREISSFSPRKHKDPAGTKTSAIDKSRPPISAADISNPPRPVRFRSAEADRSHDEVIDVDHDSFKEPNESIPDSDSDSVFLTSDEYNFEIKKEDLSDLFTKPNDSIDDETCSTTESSGDAHEPITHESSQQVAEPSPQKIDKFQNQIELAHQRIEELEAELHTAQDLKHQLLSLQQEREDLITQLSTAEKNNQQLADQINTLQASQIQTDELKQRAEQQVEKLQRQTEQDQQQIDELNRQAERQMDQLQKQSEQNQQRIEELQAEIQKQSHLNQELSNLREQYEQAIAKLSTTETSNRELIERVNSFETSQWQFAELQQQALLSEQKIAELQQQLSNVQASANFTKNSSSEDISIGIKKKFTKLFKAYEKERNLRKKLERQLDNLGRDAANQKPY